MGVPKFFRWLAERYPLVLQKVSAEPVDIDHLYLDMNGIIHNCTHANNAAKATASEDEMIHLVFQYIERLVRIAKPNKLLFMAIDGVAPRAKMNQQRSRRFRAGKERQEAEQRARRLGEELPAAGLFDSNCITPGTQFMYRLDKHLKFFVRRKLATDPSWAKLKVLYSGYDVPGEGEHKIMEFIRYEKVRVKQPAPNTRHCMYGLDADLILLSLATHEPHFCLLREEVAFNSKQRGQPSREVLEMKKDDFQLLHIGILREYLREETYLLEAAESYNFERVIDDFVLLCVLVGNDFLPHSPTLDIGEGAMDVIFETYRETLVKNGHHLTQGERISHVQLEVLLAALAEKEADTLISRAEDQVAFEIRRRRGAASEPMPVADDEGEDDGASAPEQLFSAEPTMMGAEARTLLLSGDKDAGLTSYKKRMYRKMDADDDDRVRTVVEWYMEGLHWVMQYYYRGVPSWSWYYPFHYAPFLSDMKKLQAIVCEFTQGEPVKPYQQLMMVMPTSSKQLLPQPFHPLMDDPNSPIADFYPLDFEVDGEGKRADWEAVVLLPFIDFDRLVESYNSKVNMLSPEAHSRNGTGKLYLFKYQKGSEETSFCQSTLPAMLPSITKANSTVDELLPKKPLPHGAPGFQPALTKGCLTGSKALKVGWPSMHTVPFSTAMQSVGVNLLGIVSKRPTRILMPTGADMDPESTTVLNKVSYFRYPHLMRCRVVELTDGKSIWTASEGQQPQSAVMDKAQQERIASAISEAKSCLLTEKGIDASSCTHFFRVLRNVGMLRLRDGSLTVKFEDHGDYVPAPLLLETSLGMPAPDQDQAGPQVYQKGSQFVFRGLAHYGALATVQQCNTETTPVRYHVLLKARNINFKSVTNRIRSARARADNAERWFPSFMVARRLGIESSALGRMTGSCFVTVGEKSFDVGLSLRHGTDLCVPEFAYPAPEGKGWQYSAAAAQLMAEFQQKFPWVANLCTQSNSATMLVSDAFPELDAEAQISRAKAVQSWRSQSVLNRMKLAPTTSNVASTAAVREMDTTFSAICCAGVKQLELMDVGSELLVPPLASGVSSEATASYADVGDCVVFVGTDTGTTPPFGTLGVAIAVHGDFIDVLCAEKFAVGSDLEGRVRKGYGARLGFNVLINLSDMSAAELAAPTAKPVAAGNAAKQQTAAAAAAATPAAPGIPDGTRGFHQQNGHGRGKPAGIKLTPQALLQAAGAKAMTPGATSNAQPSTTVQQTTTTTMQPPVNVTVPPSTDTTAQQSGAIPDFMMNILRHKPKGGQEAAPSPSPAQPATNVPSTPAARSTSTAPPPPSAAPQTGDDMIKMLLQAPKASTPADASGEQADSAQSTQPGTAVQHMDRSSAAPPTAEAAAQEAAWSPVRVLRVPSDSALASMGFAERRTAISKHVLQIVDVSKAIFERAGDQSLCSSARSLAKDVESSGLTSNSVQQVCRCVQTAAQLLPPGEAAVFCSQADSIVMHATNCQSTEQRMKAGTAVSENVEKLQAMDKFMHSTLQHAEHWCYLAACSRAGPPWGESENVMQLCLSLQKARAGSKPWITSSLLDKLSQSVDTITVGYDSYVNSQRGQVKHVVKEAMGVQKKVAQQIPVLSQQVASELLASCDAHSNGTQDTYEQLQAHQSRHLLVVACAQHSLPKQTVNACSAWISIIQRQNNAQIAVLNNLLSEAWIISHMGERYGFVADSDTTRIVPTQSAAPSGGGASSSVSCTQWNMMHLAHVPTQSAAPSGGGASSSMSGTQGNLMRLAVGPPVEPPAGVPIQYAPATQDESSHPPQGAETSEPNINKAAEGRQLTPTAAPVQQGAPSNGSDLIARLLQSGGGAPAVSNVAGQPATSTQAGANTNATATPGSIIGVPVAQGRPVSDSDPMVSMWNDLQG